MTISSMIINCVHSHHNVMHIISVTVCTFVMSAERKIYVHDTHCSRYSDVNDFAIFRFYLKVHLRVRIALGIYRVYCLVLVVLLPSMI